MAAEPTPCTRSACSAEVLASGPETPRQAVMLFYFFARLEDVNDEAAWHRNLCWRLGLGGRLRASLQGLNGTLSGLRAHLQRYSTEVTARHAALGAEAIDWKLTEVAASEVFDTLRVRVTAEVVTLGDPAVGFALDEAAAHLAPVDFHAELARTGDASLPPLLLDVRNRYESDIGYFGANEIQTLRPPIRQYSELPAWLRGQLPLLAGRRVLMYCTGGVRCEPASVLLRRLLEREGLVASSVAQLRGGIVRYLESFPDGGYFRGKNLVFDGRRAVGAAASTRVGRCLFCDGAAEDYTPQARCVRCRVLMLLCQPCARKGARRLCAGCTADSAALDPPGGDISAAESADAAVASSAAAAGRSSKPRSEAAGTTASTATAVPSSAVEPNVADATSAATAGHLPKLRILCLHGYRQNAEGLRGRLGQLRRKLSSHAELVFIDAPHRVGLPPGGQCTATADGDAAAPSPDDDAGPQQHAAGANAQSLLPSRSSVNWKRRGRRRDDTGAEGDGDRSSEHFLHSRTRYSWFEDLSADTGAANGQGGTAPLSKSAASTSTLPAPCTSAPARERALGSTARSTATADEVMCSSAASDRASEGWSESLLHVASAFERLGPFDGLLGFSQGAAVAAALAAMVCRRDRSGDVVAPDSDACMDPDMLGRAVISGAGATAAIRFSFVILCAGFASSATEQARLLDRATPIGMPSLHIFGNTDRVLRGLDAGSCRGTRDRAASVPQHASEALAAYFDPNFRVVVTHSGGHYLPSSDRFVRRYVDFLRARGAE